MTGPGDPTTQMVAGHGGPEPGASTPAQERTATAGRPELPSGGEGPATSLGSRASAVEPSAWRVLLTAVPWFFWSFASSLDCGAIGFGWGWLVVLLWVVSGAVVFVGPAEPLFARYLFRLRQPTLVEQERLGPIWHHLAAARRGARGGCRCGSRSRMRSMPLRPWSHGRSDAMGALHAASVASGGSPGSRARSPSGWIGHWLSLLELLVLDPGSVCLDRVRAVAR